jgi:hypothetical protein
MSTSKQLQVQVLMTVNDLGLDMHQGVDKTVFAFLERSEAVASRWVQLPNAVLLFVTVPDDPQSGAIYLFDRRKGVFYWFEIDSEANGLLTGGDYERLVREHRLLNLAHRPWSVRPLLKKTIARPGSVSRRSGGCPS